MYRRVLGAVVALWGLTAGVYLLWCLHRVSAPAVWADPAWPRPWPYPDRGLMRWYDLLDAANPPPPGRVKMCGEIYTLQGLVRSCALSAFAAALGGVAVLLWPAPGREASSGPAVRRGVAVGLGVGAAATGLLGHFIDRGFGPPWRALSVCGGGCCLAGALVGVVRQFSKLVGASAGLLAFLTLAGCADNSPTAPSAARAPGGAGLAFDAAASPATTASLLVHSPSSLCLNVAGVNTSPGGKIILWGCAGAPVNEMFAVATPGTASAVRVYGTLCLADRSGAGAAGSALTTATCNGGTAQRWTVTTAGALQNAASGACAVAAGGATTYGTAVILGSCGGADRWAAPTAPSASGSAPGAFTGLLRASVSALCLNVIDDSKVPGAAVGMWNCYSNAENEQATLVGVDIPGPVKMQTSLCLADVSGSGSVGSGVAMAVCNGSSAQRWTLTHTGQLRNAASGACVAPTGTDNGARVVLATCTGGAEQRWAAPNAPVKVPTLAAGPMPRGTSGIFGLVGRAPSVASVTALGGPWAKYESNFASWAEKHWEWEGADYNNADFYDRAQIYYVWWARSGNATYLDRANQLALNARAYMQAKNYYPQPYLMMLDGVALHAIATGDTVSANTVALTADALGNPTSYPWQIMGDAGDIDNDNRTQARVLGAVLDAWYLNIPSPGGYDYPSMLRGLLTKVLATQSADGAYRFRNQCFTSKAYMSGMLNDVLIRYYTTFEPDPRIPAAIKRSVDYLWANSWVPSVRGFKYMDAYCAGGSGGDTTPNEDLNGLMVNGFAFTGRQTGDASYFAKADTIFAGGVAGAWIIGAKQFNQFYTTSYVYLGLRP